jgi:hypothetical protein
MEIFNNFLSATKSLVTMPFDAFLHSTTTAEKHGAAVGSGSFEVGQHVMTVYGRGYVVSKRDAGGYIVKLFNWKLAQGQVRCSR